MLRERKNVTETVERRVEEMHSHCVNKGYLVEIHHIIIGWCRLSSVMESMMIKRVYVRSQTHNL